MTGRTVTFADGRKGKTDCVSHEKNGEVYYSIQLLKVATKGDKKGQLVPTGTYLVSRVNEMPVL